MNRQHYSWIDDGDAFLTCNHGELKVPIFVGDVIAISNVCTFESGSAYFDLYLTNRPHSFRYEGSIRDVKDIHRDFSMTWTRLKDELISKNIADHHSNLYLSCMYGEQTFCICISDVLAMSEVVRIEGDMSIFHIYMKHPSFVFLHKGPDSAVRDTRHDYGLLWEKLKEELIPQQLRRRF